MATVRLASYNGEEVVFEYDYNDANRRIQRVRCINNSGQNARGTVLEKDGITIVAQADFLPGTTQVSVSATQVTFDEFNDPEFPYIIKTEWPA